MSSADVDARLESPLSTTPSRSLNASPMNSSMLRRGRRIRMLSRKRMSLSVLRRVTVSASVGRVGVKKRRRGGYGVTFCLAWAVWYMTSALRSTLPGALAGIDRNVAAEHRILPPPNRTLKGQLILSPLYAYTFGLFSHEDKHRNQLRPQCTAQNKISWLRRVCRGA